MIKGIFSRTWRRSVYALMAWFSFCILNGLYVFSLYNHLQVTPDYINYLTGMPLWIHFFLGTPMHVEPAVNFLLITSLNFIVPLIWIILVIRIGVDEIAGEEERGGLDFLLAHPLARCKLYIIKVTAYISLVLFMALIFWASLITVIQITAMPVGMTWVLTCMLEMVLFVLWVGLLAMFAAAWWGNTDKAMLMSAVLLILLWLLKGAAHVNLLPVVWQWFNPLGLVFMSINENNPMILLATGIMLVVVLFTIFAGIWIWQRRSFLTWRDVI